MNDSEIGCDNISYEELETPIASPNSENYYLKLLENLMDDRVRQNKKMINQDDFKNYSKEFLGKDRSKNSTLVATSDTGLKEVNLFNVDADVDVNDDNGDTFSCFKNVYPTDEFLQNNQFYEIVMNVNKIYVTFKSPYFLKVKDLDEFINEYIKGKSLRFVSHYIELDEINTQLKRIYKFTLTLRYFP